MPKRIYLFTRDAHLYAGLFMSPFLILFACSAVLLVHPGKSWSSATMQPASTQVREGLTVPNGIENLSGRAQVDAVRPLLEQAGIRGEIEFIRYIPREHRMSIPVSVPGRETTFDIDLVSGTATVTRRETGFRDALIRLHKSPGQHLADIRMNWFPMRVWRWLADATVWLVLFISVSGVYLWLALRAERRVGLMLLLAGAVSLWGMVYALAG